MYGYSVGPTNPIRDGVYTTREQSEPLKSSSMLTQLVERPLSWSRKSTAIIHESAFGRSLCRCFAAISNDASWHKETSVLQTSAQKGFCLNECIGLISLFDLCTICIVGSSRILRFKTPPRFRHDPVVKYRV
jgi:hypothetical protein